jgi:hypothetical protein
MFKLSYDQIVESWGRGNLYVRWGKAVLGALEGVLAWEND